MQCMEGLAGASRRVLARMPLALCLAGLTVLAACGGGTENATPPAPGASTPAPLLTFTTNATQVSSGASATLTWSATNATSCSASGSWSGSKPTSGSESVGPLSSNASYDLTCSGDGGSVNKNVTIQVSPTPEPAPTVSLEASPTQVEPNGSATLTWSSTNATQCTASGGWSGSKATSGSLMVGPLAAATLFTLSCSGAGGTATVSANVDVAPSAPGTLSGMVDSSLVDAAGIAQVYVFKGDVTPDDRDGDSGDPAYVADVTQDANACTFRYSVTNLPAGTYTVALTSEAQNDQVGVNDSITFSRKATVTIGTSALSQDFAASRVLRVGSGKTYSKIADAAAAAQDGDVIEVDAGTYPDDVIVWRQNHLVVRGVGGGRAHVQGNRVIGIASGDDRQNGKGLWVTEGSGIRVENIEFSDAKVTDGNGAGIRNDGRNLTVCNGYFHDNEDGFLGTAAGTLTIEYSTFSHNGTGDGYTHNVYVDDGGSDGDKLVFQYNDSNNVSIGHTLKTRSRENYILYNRLVDETTGTSSYNIDVPNGGLTYVIGNVIQQGPNTDNSVIVAYGAEGLSSGRTHALYMVNNTLVNDRGSGVFVSTASGATEFRSINNLYAGGGTVFQGKQPTTATTDVVTSSPGFVDGAAFNYRLTNTSPTVDAGSDPGTASGYALQPQFQVVTGGRREPRPVAGALDAGAYEFAP